jgi:hypothetical protein
MAEQPVNLSTVLYLGAFSRADQRLGRRELKRMAYLAVPAKPSRATHRRGTNVTDAVQSKAACRAQHHHARSA